MLTFLEDYVNHPRVNAVIDRMDASERDKLIAVTERWQRLLAPEAFSSKDRTERPVRLPPAPFVDRKPAPAAVMEKETEGRLRPIPAIEPPTAQPAFGQFSVFDLKRTACRAPITCEDGTATIHKFCGRDAVPGLPYCECHARVFYQSFARRSRGHDGRETQSLACGSADGH